MSTASHSAILVAVMSLVTILLRFLPFLVFRKKVPPCITYLGRVLPPAIIGMLVIYCLKDTVITSAPFGLPELIAGVMVVLLQAWKRNALLSILCGTVVYMLLIQLVFA
ncbi:branched-chain amino acid transporter permease [Aristaeella lactis]|uniref:Branched-chain amino acid transport protein AzlD n=1 Tax=Aristaeella lactis TaxID=3046383 RepID=A0AC61PK74_9FIRM|nr:AzlD domain-containing protein [Aristaeella lactis]QUA51865.1 AzlD domain-containing protein [Aristaeella lactis]SMC52542.1 Branched-chain amino acid transport protein AzlD [Aristaeella lactis]